MKRGTDLSVFESMPVGRAVLKNVAPSVVSMLMVLVYNLADTFFIGLTRDDMQVAAVSIATHVFLIFMGLGTIFGVGGTSVISRAFGEGRVDYVKKVSAFCMWASVAVGVAIAALFIAFMDDVLRTLGASEDTWKPTKSYLSIVMLCGPFVLVANAFSNILRSEGQAARAMMGMLIGNLVNVVLDPVMILWLRWEIAGAAIATVIGNIAGAGYYIMYFLRGKSRLSIDPRDFAARGGVAKSVFAIGVPAALGPMFMSLSQIIMNRLMAGFNDLAIAAAGVAVKSILVIYMVSIGLSQGIMPLLGYCVGAKNWARYKAILKFSLIFSTALSVAMTGACLIFSDEIIGMFLTEKRSFEYGVKFAYILLSTAFMSGAFFCLISAISAIGAPVPALILNISRQGIIYIPALFVLRSFWGEYGLIWAQPVSDVLSLILAIALHIFAFRKLRRR